MQRTARPRFGGFERGGYVENGDAGSDAGSDAGGDAGGDAGLRIRHCRRFTRFSRSTRITIAVRDVAKSRQPTPSARREHGIRR